MFNVKGLVLVFVCHFWLGYGSANGQFFVCPETGNTMSSGNAISDSGEFNFSVLLAQDNGELELSKPQKDLLDREIKKIGESNWIANGEYQSGKRTEVEFSELVRRNQKQVSSLVESTLLPFQVNNLRRIAVEKMIAHSTLPDVISSKPISELLNLTPEQTRKLKDKSAKLQKELDEKIRKLKEEARSELLTELSPSQRQLLGYGDIQGKK